jgi:hypothetical protein
MDGQKFEQWALVELFGHQRIAGRVSELAIGGCAFVRVDVPELPATDEKPAVQAVTKLYSQAAIYGMTFLDEAACMVFVRQLRIEPIDEWSLRRAMQDLPARGLEATPRQPALQGDPADDIPY